MLTLKLCEILKLAMTQRPNQAFWRWGGYCRVWFVWLLFWAAFTPPRGFAEGEPEDDGGPLLLSILPSAGEPGKTVKVEVRGVRLDGAHAIWLDKGPAKGRVLSIEDAKEQVKQRLNPLEKLKIAGPFHRVLIELQLGTNTTTGVHLLRLVSNHGISNPLGFLVAKVPVTVEAPTSHETTAQAQPVIVPGLISGKVGEAGEVDFYSFPAKKGQRLRFEVVEEQKFEVVATIGKFATELAVYRSGGSWLDPARPTKVLSEEERSSDLMRVEAQGTYGFSEEGQYFLQVSGLFGQGCPDCTYQVRVLSLDGTQAAREESANVEWLERSFERPLTNTWMTQLEARSVTTRVSGGEVSSTGAPSVVDGEPKPTSATLGSTAAERPPDGSAGKRRGLSVPTFVEGTIRNPGQVDSFKLKVESGQKLAFEIETAGAKPPYFNPRLSVVDSQDHELFSNVERRLSMFNNNADPQVYLKNVQPKSTYSFERGGEYLVQLRDITSRYGGSDYRYRILVRPEIPHLGEVSVIARDGAVEGTPGAPKPNEINRFNLVRGEPKKVILVVSYEEGFTGDVSFLFDGLPEGVKAFPGIQFSESRGPLEVVQNPEVIAPKQQKTVMVLLAGAEALLTAQPRIVQLRCQPIVNGKVGPNLLVREIPLMVVEAPARKEEKKSSSGK
jgi:hypothetical protein